MASKFDITSEHAVHLLAEGVREQLTRDLRKRLGAAVSEVMRHFDEEMNTYIEEATKTVVRDIQTYYAPHDFNPLHVRVVIEKRDEVKPK